VSVCLGRLYVTELVTAAFAEALARLLGLS
jgi:hypothetical protein